MRRSNAASAVVVRLPVSVRGINIRLSLILTVWIVLAGTTAAQANLIDVQSEVLSAPPFGPVVAGTTTYANVLNYTRTAVTGTVDQLIVNLCNLDAMAGGSARKLQVFEGAFTSTGSLYTPPDGFDPSDIGYIPSWVPYVQRNYGPTADVNHTSWVSVHGVKN
jgi:hypothetical protein